MALSSADTAQLNEFNNFLSFVETEQYRLLINSTARTILELSGNQGGKTGGAAHHYVRRFLGYHPIAEKNSDYYVCKNDHTQAIITAPKNMRCKICDEQLELYCDPTDWRIYRFASHNLPGTSGGDHPEVRNTQYPQLKKWLPPYLLKKDINSRSPVVSIADIHGGPDILVEFVSYGQDVQATAGPQRKSLWCVAKNQRVLMEDGVWRPIQDIQYGDRLICETIGGYGDNQRVNTVKNVIHNGVKDVYRFNCNKGISFEVTEDHLVMIPGQGKSTYKKAIDIKQGDHIKCKLSEIEPSNIKEDWELALFGLVLGDGDLTQKTIKITNSNDELMESLVSKLPSWIKVRKFSGKRTPDWFFAGGKKLKNKFSCYGLLGKKADSKYVPSDFFRLPDEQIALFLRYLYAADGWASGHMIGYCSTSKRLSDDVFLLLRRLGIRSTRITKTFSNHWNDQYWINITQARDVLNFIDRVGIQSKSDAIEKVRIEAERRLASRLKTGPFGDIKNDDWKPKQYVVVKSIEHIGKREVYDITMESNGITELNNFLISGGVVVHNCDEQPPFDFMEEQYGRLLAANGDILYSMTAADKISWVYDEVFEKASEVHRTENVVNAPLIKSLFGELERHEKRNTGKDICVIQFATDDNPTLNPQAIDDLFSNIDDDSTMARRRYGMFAQASGRVLKSYRQDIHFQPMNKWFKGGVPHNWVHARGIDYHQRVPWHYAACSLSPHDEMFVWAELRLPPDMLSTEEMSERISMETDKEYRFILDLIDPLAHTIVRTENGRSFTTVDDLNRYFSNLKKNDIGSGAYWQVWDTKSLRGREQLRLRLKNSVKCRVPFNNEVEDDKGKRYLPTIWIMDTCPNVAHYLRMWRHEENKGRDDSATKDEKEDVQQKWSHFPMVLEGILKEKSFKARIGERMLLDRDVESHRYFTARGR